MYIKQTENWTTHSLPIQGTMQAWEGFIHGGKSKGKIHVLEQQYSKSSYNLPICGFNAFFSHEHVHKTAAHLLYMHSSSHNSCKL